MVTVAEEPMSQAKLLRSLYSIMTGIENNLGGGEGVEGLYGSISGTHMQRLLTAMREHCGLGPRSHLVDIGAGLGRPLLHALVTEGVAATSGVELDSIKCMKAEAFLRQAAAAATKRGLAPAALPLPSIRCAPVQAVDTLDPATHAYSFWEGVPVDARVAFGRLFAGSRTLQAVTVVQRAMRCADPAALMDDAYDFGPLRLVDHFTVNMSGSGSAFQAYVFVRDGALPAGGASPRRRAAAAAADGARVPAPPHSADPLAPRSDGSEGATAAAAVARGMEEPEVVSPRKSPRKHRAAALVGALFEESEAEEVEEEAAGGGEWQPSRQTGPARGGHKRKAAPRAPQAQKAAAAAATTPSPRKKARAAAGADAAPASPPCITRSMQPVLGELAELPARRSPVKRAAAAVPRGTPAGQKGGKQMRQRTLLLEPGAFPPRRRGRPPNAAQPASVLRSSPRKAAPPAVALDELPPTVANTPLASPREGAKSPAKKSPAKSPGRLEARGLLDCSLVGQRWLLDASVVAEFLADSAYPRTRHALREVGHA